MPDVSGGAGIAGLAMQGFTDAFNVAATQHANQQQQDWASQMYDKQFANNVKFWNMQNEYNAPAQQMARFKAAGLNPNLIYGQGNAGNAGPISTPDIQSVNYKAPQVSGANPLAVLNAVADLKIKAAQADNLKAQNTVLLEEGALKHSQGLTSDFNLGLSQDLRATSADYRREQLRQLTQQIDQSISENARREVANAASVDEIMERITKSQVERGNLMLDRGRIQAEKGKYEADTANSLQQFDLLKLDSKLRQMDIDLRKTGVMPHDVLWQRAMAQIIDRLLH